MDLQKKTNLMEPLLETRDLLTEEDVVYEEPDALTRLQINRALIDIEAVHPLKQMVKVEHLLPQLSFILKRCFKRKPDFKTTLRETLLKQMKFKLPKAEVEIKQDPFLLLGYGVNAYFDIMLSFCTMFLCITAFMIPVFAGYAGNEVAAL